MMMLRSYQSPFLPLGPTAALVAGKADVVAMLVCIGSRFKGWVEGRLFPLRHGKGDASGVIGEQRTMC